MERQETRETLQGSGHFYPRRGWTEHELDWLAYERAVSGYGDRLSILRWILANISLEIVFGIQSPGGAEGVHIHMYLRSGRLSKYIYIRAYRAAISGITICGDRLIVSYAIN